MSYWTPRREVSDESLDLLVWNEVKPETLVVIGGRWCWLSTSLAWW